MNIVTIGGATQDIFIEYQAQTADLDTELGKRCFLIMQEGQKIEIDHLAYYTGGGATNAAQSFKRLGFDVECIFKIGNDSPGAYILKELNKEGINTNYHVASKTTPTALSFIIPCPSGDRTILAYRGANKTLEFNDINLDALKNCNQLYITSLSGQASSLLEPLVKYAKNHKIRVAVNPGSSQLKNGADQLCKALPYIDILIMNNFEAQLLMNSLTGQGKAKNPQSTLDLNQFFSTMFDQGLHTVVVTHGAQGVYAATQSKTIFHKAIPVKVISSVGAGDAFGSTFVASLLQGKNLDDAVRCGMVNSASVISHVGAKTGLLTRDEIEKKLQHLDKNLLQIIS